MPQTVDKIACTNLDVDWNVGHSLSVGGPPSAHLHLWGFPWTRYSRRSLAHPLQSTMFKNLDRTPFVYKLEGSCVKESLLFLLLGAKNLAAKNYA